jgi:triose/dihydroxyacetone kinase / FAD-AMP lyase (cyclizing)
VSFLGYKSFRSAGNLSTNKNKMQKKLINSAETLVPESLSGLIKTYPHLNLIEGHNIIVRSDIEKIRKKQVSLISGGGSGHEPAHSLYVGEGKQKLKKN